MLTDMSNCSKQFTRANSINSIRKATVITPILQTRKPSSQEAYSHVQGSMAKSKVHVKPLWLQRPPPTHQKLLSN